MIQTPEAPASQKKARPRDLFVWECRLCERQYPEGTHLPIDVIDGMTQRKCVGCGGNVSLEMLR